MNIEKNSISEETSENHKNPIKNFWNNHKNGILICTSVVFIIGGGVLASAIGIKKHRESFDVWQLIKNLNLDELKEKIEIVQTEYLNHTVNDDYRDDLSKIMNLINKRIRELEWAGVTPSGPAYHREDGYNLYRPD